MDLRERPSGDFVRHPWETARFGFFAAFVAPLAAERSPLRVLDVGAGDAWLATQLDALFGERIAVTCWDRAYTGELVRALAAETSPRIRFCAERPAERFDLLLLLDVLEHVEDDAAFLGRLIAENLASGGRALVSVPAWPWLFSRHDRELAHFRRYTPRGLRALLEASGLRVLRSGGLFPSLLAARLPGALLERVRGAPPRAERIGSWPFGPTSARWVHAALVADAALSRAASRLRLGPPGLSCWAECERSG